mmetsp:Transcript_46733/g.130094  ORF Transcript_46733/g.130094 Transcript_46733/m.130094 type:complete len:351 (+) Transcript_46733:587-1639(+)
MRAWATAAPVANSSCLRTSSKTYTQRTATSTPTMEPTQTLAKMRLGMMPGLFTSMPSGWVLKDSLLWGPQDAVLCRWNSMDRTLLLPDSVSLLLTDKVSRLLTCMSQSTELNVVLRTRAAGSAAGMFGRESTDDSRSAGTPGTSWSASLFSSSILRRPAKRSRVPVPCNARASGSGGSASCCGRPSADAGRSSPASPAARNESGSPPGPASSSGAAGPSTASWQAGLQKSQGSLFQVGLPHPGRMQSSASSSPASMMARMRSSRSCCSLCCCSASRTASEACRTLSCHFTCLEWPSEEPVSVSNKPWRYSVQASRPEKRSRTSISNRPSQLRPLPSQLFDQVDSRPVCET